MFLPQGAVLALGSGALRPKGVVFIDVAQDGTILGSEGEKQGRGAYPVLSRAQPRTNMDPWFLFPLLWPKLGHIGHT